MSSHGRLESPRLVSLLVKPSHCASSFDGPDKLCFKEAMDIRAEAPREEDQTRQSTRIGPNPFCLFVPYSIVLEEWG